jgi:hypothetical protein
MHLHLAGINHYDSLGRQRLKRLLEELVVQEGSLPAFVAVEWDERIFEKVPAQHAEVRDLARAATQRLPDLLERGGEPSYRTQGLAVHVGAVAQMPLLRFRSQVFAHRQRFSPSGCQWTWMAAVLLPRPVGAPPGWGE